MKRWLALAVIGCLPSLADAGWIATFEDVGLPANSVNNDAGPGGFFVSGGSSFNNSYSSAFGGIWNGWAMSNRTDTTTPGYTNQYSAIPGAGANGSATYAVAFPFADFGAVDPFHPDNAFVNLPAGTSPVSIALTNTTFAYLSMLEGDSYAHAFGPGDFFRLTITGYDSLNGTGAIVGAIDFYLANFLDSNSYIVNTWETVDLSGLKGAQSLRFGLESSDNNDLFGINTPAYFAADDLEIATPEPSTLVLLGLGAAGLAARRLRRRRALAPLA